MSFQCSLFDHLGFECRPRKVVEDLEVTRTDLKHPFIREVRTFIPLDLIAQNYDRRIDLFRTTIADLDSLLVSVGIDVAVTAGMNQLAGLVAGKATDDGEQQ